MLRLMMYKPAYHQICVLYNRLIDYHAVLMGHIIQMMTSLRIITLPIVLNKTGLLSLEEHNTINPLLLPGKNKQHIRLIILSKVQYLLPRKHTEALVVVQFQRLILNMRNIMSPMENNSPMLTLGRPPRPLTPPTPPTCASRTRCATTAPSTPVRSAA